MEGEWNIVQCVGRARDAARHLFKMSEVIFMVVWFLTNKQPIYYYNDSVRVARVLKDSISLHRKIIIFKHPIRVTGRLLMISKKVLLISVLS